MTSPILQELLKHTTALRALARELVGDARADDIVQEAAVQTLVAPPTRPGPAGGWLATVVRNLASKHRRAERTRQRHEILAARTATVPPDRSAEDADTLRRLTEIVTALPEPYRGTLLARYVRDQTPSQIAAATNTPVRTVKTRLQRGLTLLRQRLDERDRDWRATLVAAFALDRTLPATRPMPMATTDKLVLSVAVLVPVAFVIWSNLPGSTRTSTDTAMAVRDATAAAAPPAAAVRSGRDASPATTTSDPDLPAPVRPPAPLDFTPTDDPPMIRLDVVGPAAFRAAFRHTNIGSLFASEAGERLWRPLLAPAERIWREWDGRGEAFEATRRIILDYAGRIRVLWMVQPGEKGDRDRWCGVFALEMDDHTDLTALASDLAHPLLVHAPQAPTERTVGEHAVRLLDDRGGDFVTMPMVIDGRLVAFFGEAGALEQGVPRCLRALATDVAPPTAPVSLHIDLTQLQGLAPMREDPQIGTLFGVPSLRSLDATVSPNSVHAQLEIEVAFGDGDRGLLAGFLPAVGTLPDLLARVPAAATPWLTVPLDVGALFRAGLQMAATTKAHRDGGVASVRKAMHDETGLYLDTELLDHLGGEVMVLGDLWQSDDAETFRRGEDPPLGACIAFSLRDTVAFGTGLDKLLDYLKGHVNRFDSREVDGVRITRLGTMFSTGMHMAVGQDLFAMAFGAEGVAQLEALVARGRRPAEQPLPAAVQRVRHLAPAGLNGVGLADLRAMLGGQVALVIEMLDDALPRGIGFELSVDATQERLDRLLPLIEEYELQNLVTMTGYADGVWRLRLLW